MELTEKAEEILETLWTRTREGNQDTVSTLDLSVHGTEPLNELRSAGYVTRTDGAVGLTEEGRPLAENVVRRHRLAERLLVDVLNAGEITHEKACKFEHLLDRGLDERICSLLGHPKVCPHGKPIPPGKCCQEMRVSSTRLVSPLSQLLDGQNGKVAYIYAPKLDQLQKLTAMGILPGAEISVLQSFPAHVFQVGQTQFAVDREVADAIYVRLTEGEMPEKHGQAPSAGRRWWRWGRRAHVNSQ